MADTDVSGLTITIDPSSFSGVGKAVATEFVKELAGGAMDSIKKILGDTVASAVGSGADTLKQQMGFLSKSTVGGADAVAPTAPVAKTYFSDNDAKSMQKMDSGEKREKIIEHGTAMFTANLNTAVDEESLQKNITDFVQASNVKLGLGLDPAEIDKLVKEIQGVATAAKTVFEGVFKEPGESIFTEVVSAHAIRSATELAKKGFESIRATYENHITSVNRQATELAMPWIGADAATHAYQSVGDALMMYRNEMYEAVKSTGLSNKSLQELAVGFKGAGVDALKFGRDVNESSETSTNSSQFIAEAAAVVKGAGMSLSEGGAQLGFAMRNLGLDQRGAIESLGVMAEVAGETGESLDKVRSTMEAGRRQLKFYGDTTEGVATVYAKLLKTVGDGKADWASEFLNTIVQGVSNMNAGLAAFIGQASGIGRGQGAIGSMLEVEEKIASGDVQGVLDAVTEQIENISGSKLLTRQESIDTGQQEQFFLQRELLKNFGFGGGSQEETTRLLENLARGQEIPAEQFSGKSGVETLRGRGEGVIRAEEGGFGMASNYADAVSNLAATERAAQIMFDSSAQFENAVGLMTKAIPDFAAVITSKNKGEMGGTRLAESGEKDLIAGTDYETSQVLNAQLAEKHDVGGITERMDAGAKAAGATVDAAMTDKAAQGSVASESLKERESAINHALPVLENLSTASKDFATSVATLAQSLEKFMAAEQKKADERDKKSEEPTILNVKIDTTKAEQAVKAHVLSGINKNAQGR